MTTDGRTFSSLDVPQPLKLAGTFVRDPLLQRYRPRMFVSDGLIAALQSLLYQGNLSGFGESPEVLADWFFCRFDPEQSRHTHASSVCLFRDGYWGNDEGDEEAVIFCRRDHDFLAEDHREVWRVHIPDDEEQSILLTASSGYRTDPDKLGVLHEYLSFIINEQEAWGEIIADFGEDEERSLVPAAMALLEAQFHRLEERVEALGQENQRLRDQLQSLQRVGEWGQCWNCDELIKQEDLNDGLCESCEGTYVHCLVCKKWLDPEDAHTHLHLFQDHTDGDWLGSGGRDMDSHFEEQIKVSLFVLLDNWADVPRLVRVIQQRSNDDFAFGFYGDKECPEAVVCRLPINGQNQSAYVSFENLSDDLRASMSKAIQWLATLDGEKTAAANLLTLAWISEWQDSHQANPA